ncbi:hypothetical protein SKDZ_09G0550 [Saccharomyces kudriavzevii ZP591]|nr:hypothetical protein SKDZ_09G0550 [Saccharomyces kudriavzevii ZP591]
MSSLGDEVPTKISEDFGFKFLGQKRILPSFNEKPPFASLQNLAISNSKSLFIAASGNKVAIGELQLLRDHITSDSAPLTFKWETTIADVIFVCFHGDEALISTKNTLHSINLDELSELQTISSFENPVCQLKIFKNTLIFLNSNNDLTALDLNAKSAKPLAQNVASFDVAKSQLVILLKDRNFQSFSMENNPVDKQFEFSIPSELKDLSLDDYAPLDISILSQRIYFVVFGNSVSDSDEEASYDQKMFIVRYTDGGASFQETFDITAPFGQIVRSPYVYDITLPGLIKPAMNVNILASSCSSEISIWDSEEVIEPSQDAKRAVLPISEETDMDTNPIGVAVDIVTSGIISEPCSGVDAIERLPLIYVLNNEGNLQIVGLFHATSIKTGHYNVKLESEENERPASPSTSEKITLVGQEEEEENKEKEKKENMDLSASSASENPFISPNISGGFGFLKKQQATTNSLQSQISSAVGAPSFGSTPFSLNSSLVSSGTSGTATNDLSTAGAAFGKPAFGSAAKEPSASGAAFGKPSFGTPAFGSGVTAAESSTSGSAFGKPSFGTPSFSSAAKEPSASGSAFGKTSFGAPAFGSGVTAAESSTSGSTFGKPSFGTSAFGTVFSEPNTTGSAFGKPAFGSSTLAFARNGQFDSSSTISKPIFGDLSQGSSTSPFAALGKHKEDKSKSDVGFSSTPFAADLNVSGKPNTNTFDFGNAPFGSSSFSNALNSVDTDTPFALDTQSSPFSSQLDNKSPFSSLVEDNTKNEATDNYSPSEVGDEDEDEINGSDISTNDLTDSTVEQTPSTRLAELSSNTNSEVLEEERQKSPIGRITETIKKSANIDMISLKNPVFENHVKAKSESPFSAFATNINKPSSTTPAFSFGTSTVNKVTTSTTADFSEDVPTSSPGKIDNGGNPKSAENPFLPKVEGSRVETIEEENSQETKNATSESIAEKSHSASQHDIGTPEQTTPTVENVNSDKKLKTGAEDNLHVVADYDDKCRESEGTTEKHEKTGRQTLEAREDERDGNEEGSEQNMDVKGLEDRHSVEDIVSGENDRQSNETKESDNNSSLSSGKEESISDSYDKLEDINTDELPHGGEPLTANDGVLSADFDVQTSPENSYAESGIQTDFSENSQEHEVQTDAIPVKHNYTQTIEKEVIDNDIQTDPIETCDFCVQAFENNENYLAEQYKPKPLKKYYTGAKVSNISFVSQNSTVRLIESTFQMVEAEFVVLKENIQNMDSFLIDQSSNPLETRTIKSINNLYTWRIPEAKILLNIQNDVKSEHTQETNSQVQALEEKVSNYVEKNIAKMSDDLINAKEQYLFLTHFNESSSEYFKDLSTHQFRMQKTLRQKLSTVSAKINHIEELLNILKLLSMKNKKLDENPLVTKLAKESLTRGGLLEEIKSLREEVNKLQLGEKSAETLSLEPSSSLAKNIKASKVVEVGLAMNTKKQIGDFFKSLNLAN